MPSPFYFRIKEGSRESVTEHTAADLATAHQEMLKKYRHAKIFIIKKNEYDNIAFAKFQQDKRVARRV